MSHGIHRCGDNRWWIDDARLHIRRERGAKQLLKGIAGLALSAGLFVLISSPEYWDPEGVLAALAMFAYGVQNALGVWEVTLDRVRGKVSWAWGLGVPLFRWTRPLEEFDRVRLVTQARGKEQEVRLSGTGKAQHLAESDDAGEVRGLSEAVARHARLGLQVGTGRVRPAGELVPPERAQALAQLSARLQAPVSQPSAMEVPKPPPGCRIQVNDKADPWELVLPEPGWVEGFRFQARVGAGVVAVTLALGGYLLSFHPDRTLVLMVAPFAGVGLLMGANFVWKAVMGAINTSRITVSRPGLEVERSTSGLPHPQRIPARLIRDIDVRDHVDGAPMTGMLETSSSPMLLIERYDGKVMALGAGLPRAELEWAAARLRQRLAEEAEARREDTGTA